MKKTHLLFFVMALVALVWYGLYMWLVIAEYFATAQLLMALPWVFVFGLWARLLDERALKKCQCSHELPVEIVPRRDAVPRICGTCRLFRRCGMVQGDDPVAYDDEACSMWKDRRI